METVSGLRVIPNLDVIRPGDAEETAGAFVAAMSRTDGPTALILTRQAIPLMNELSVEARRDGVLRGGYIARKETGALTTILLATGSELQHAMAAAAELGDGVRVVSMPCFERFDRQSAEYRESVLPPPAPSASPSKPASPASGGNTSAPRARSSASTASASAPRATPCSRNSASPRTTSSPPRNNSSAGLP